MEDLNKVEKLINDLKHYAEVRYDLIVLNLQDKLSELISSFASIALLSILAVFILLFGSIGGALWLGEYFHCTSIGFFCVAGFYFVLALLLFFSRETLIKLPVINALLKKINNHGHN